MRSPLIIQYLHRGRVDPIRKYKSDCGLRKWKPYSKSHAIGNKSETSEFRTFHQATAGGQALNVLHVTEDLPVTCGLRHITLPMKRLWGWGQIFIFDFVTLSLALRLYPRWACPRVAGKMEAKAKP
jgi:hypothetical protein